MISPSGMAEASSTFMASPMAWKRSMAASRGISSRVTGMASAVILRISASMAARSSGVKNFSTWKS